MSIWQRLKRLRTDSQQKNTYTYISGEIPKLDPSNPAAQENQNLDEPFSDSQAVSLSGDQSDGLYQWWIMLSPREQDVTALTCLKYTNPQIAARLGLSIFTVNTYIEKVLIRFGLQSKADLRVVFANWDFSAWESRKPHR
jgi:DNA-binding CsgD family transcriptional regulator